MYNISMTFTKSGSSVMTFPNMKILKDFVKQALKPEEGSLKGLDKIHFIKQGQSKGNLTDVTKWFFESFHGSHANKEEKAWIEKNIFKKELN